MDRKGIVVTGGGTFAVACLGGGAKLAFPDMIVPFGWAIGLIIFGVIVGIATLIYAFWPHAKTKSDDSSSGPEYNQTHSGSGDNRMDF